MDPEITLSSVLFIYHVFFFFFWQYEGLNPGAFYLQAVPPALFFILYFETGSHKVAEGLTKERERERERETGRERERES